MINLGTPARASSPNNPSQCSLSGPIFSIAPANLRPSGWWTVKSPSVEGWKRYASEGDFQADWLTFTEGIRSFQRLGCFSPTLGAANIVRTIAEKIPIPSSESLLFFYSFSREGFVDLSPNMQLKFDKSLIRQAGNSKTVSSVEATYEVYLTPAGLLGFRLTRTLNRQLANQLGIEGASLFELTKRVKPTSTLRLFLESVDKDIHHAPLLVASSNFAELDKATNLLSDGNVNACTTMTKRDIRCTTFNSSVSLLIPCWINGKLSYKPFGTTVAQVLGNDPAKLKTASLMRPLNLGGYGAIVFPKTLEAASQIILQNGDRLAWQT